MQESYLVLSQGGGRLYLDRFSVKATLFHLDLMELMLQAVSCFWCLLHKGVALVFILRVIEAGVFKLGSSDT